jgi:NADH dehydrogenase/NADH:ubiquinone oxidoreductase subunit G
MRALMGFKPGGPINGSEPGKAVVLVSATATLEEMYLFQRLAKECLKAPIFVARHIPDGDNDRLLRRADKHANARGAEMLGLRVLDLQKGSDDAVTGALGSGGVLITVGFNTHVEALAPALARASSVIALSGCVSSLTGLADLVVPGLTFAEKDGLVVNFEGHVQQLRPAIDSKGETEWRIADALLASLRGTKPYESVAHVRKAIVDSVPAFAGVDLVKLGPTGVRVAAQPVA